MKGFVLWMPITAILLGSCASSSTPLPPHLKFDEAVSKYGQPSHNDRVSDGGSIAVFQRKVGPAITTYTLTFDAAGQCVDGKVEAKATGSDHADNLDELTKIKNVCYNHSFDAH